MEKLAIFEYTPLKLHFFNIDKNIDTINDEYIESIGFNSNDCYWMAGDIEVIEHLGILT